MMRVLALLGAALLIVIAVLVRGLIDDDGDTDDPSNGDNETAAELVVACVTELEDVCERLDVADLRVEAPGDTIANPDDVDAWVTFDPWPEIAAFDDDPPRELIGNTIAAASSDLLLLLRSASLNGCADWACAGDTGRAALPRPDGAFALVAAGHAAQEWSAVTRPGEPFAGQELSLPEFRMWLRSIDRVADPVDDMLVLENAGPFATAITAASFETDVSRSPRAQALATAPGALPATVVVVVTGPGAGEIVEPLRAALVNAGWEPAEPAARSTGVPRAGVLFALSEEVS